jgi:hypothetical protein
MVEVVRVPIKLKPFLDNVDAMIGLADMGNEFPPDPDSQQRYTQQLSLVPQDEAQLYGENHDGQFFRYRGSQYHVGVRHTVYKDDLRIQKHLFSFEIDIPALNGMSVTARFKGRLRRGVHNTVLKAEGMRERCRGYGNLYVELTVK